MAAFANYNSSTFFFISLDVLGAVLPSRRVIRYLCDVIYNIDIVINRVRVLPRRASGVIGAAAVALGRADVSVSALAGARLAWIWAEKWLLIFIWLNQRLILSWIAGARRGLVEVVAVAVGVGLPTRVRHQRRITSRVEILQPRIGPEVMRSRTVVGVDLHASRYDTSWSRRHVLWYRQVAVHDFAVELLIILSPIRKLSTKESK